MAVLLLILGIVVAASGVAAIGFGIPLNEFTLGTALISGGATALTGGLILIGLSAVVTELSRLAGKQGAMDQGTEPAFEPANRGAPANPRSPPLAVPSPRPAGAPVPARVRPETPGRESRLPPTPQPSASAVDVSAAAIERLRSTIPRAEGGAAEASVPGPAEEAPLSPNGPAQFAPPRSRPEPSIPEPRVSPEDRPAGDVETMKASRLDFLFRSKPGRTAPEAPSFETIWPADARGTKAAPPPRPVQEPSPQPVEPPQAKPSRPAPEPAPVPPPAAVSVLKSGVVDGMPYTLYSDGSIEAQLPEGTIRFSSVAELRSHIETSS